MNQVKSTQSCMLLLPFWKRGFKNFYAFYSVPGKVGIYYLITLSPCTYLSSRACLSLNDNLFLKFILLYSMFLLVIYFIHIGVYMLIPISQFIPPPPPPPPPRHCPPLVSIRLFSTSVSLFLPCKPVHLYHFSRFHIYALIYDICFSLSDLLHSVWVSRSIHVSTNDPILFLFMAE